MSLWHAMLLGLIQGFTEFLPVSSSGHLALAQLLLPGFSQPGLVFDVSLHLGTAVAVVVAEWHRLRRAFQEGSLGQLLLLLAVGTAATGVVAFPLRPWAERAFSLPLPVAGGLLLTGVLLLASRLGEHPRPSAPQLRQAVLVGLVQGCAVFPGLSRSGSTIAAGLWAGIERRWAADFSFLLSLPAIAGAALVEGWENRTAFSSLESSFAIACGVGTLTAGVSGFVALLLVRRLVWTGKLHLFAWYVFPLAALVLAGVFFGWWHG